MERITESPQNSKPPSNSFWQTFLKASSLGRISNCSPTIANYSKLSGSDVFIHNSLVGFLFSSVVSTIVFTQILPSLSCLLNSTIKSSNLRLYCSFFLLSLIATLPSFTSLSPTTKTNGTLCFSAVLILLLRLSLGGHKPLHRYPYHSIILFNLLGLNR